VSKARVPLVEAGDVRIIAFHSGDGSVEHLAILFSDPNPAEPVLVRLPFSCQRAAASASSTSCAPISCRTRGSTRSLPTRSSASMPMSASIARAAMLRQLGIARLRPLINNPKKVAQLTRLGIAVVERVSHVFSRRTVTTRYLRTKATRRSRALIGSGWFFCRGFVPNAGHASCSWGRRRRFSLTLGGR
jgi:GTP cyclohydrolase II